MITRTNSLQSRCGETLHLRIWSPEGGTGSRGSLILAHGLGGHSGRYHQAARHFTSRGFRVYGPDLVGFGQSGGARGDVPGGVETFAADLRQVGELAAEEQDGEGRQIYLGHSMGGLTVLKLMREEPDLVREAVIDGPAIHSGSGSSMVQLALIHLLSLVAPGRTTDHGIAAERISADPEVVEDYQEDPLVHRRMSMRLAGSILREGARIRREAVQFPAGCSLLLFNGAEDDIAAPEATRDFGARVSAGKKKTLVMEDMKHEVFTGRGKEEVYQEIDRFFGLLPTVTG